VKGEAGELARHLGERIDALVRDLLPRGRRNGIWWRVGSLAGEEGQSLAVTLSGHRRGRWTDWEADQGGDALDLVAQIECNGDKIAAMDWARDWLGLPAFDPSKPLAERKPRRPVPTATDGRAEAERLLKRNRNRASEIFLSANPVERDDQVWRYFAGRSIDLSRLPQLPRVLRCHPKLWNEESQRAWPALVAMITDVEGRNCAVHRTWLEERNLAFEDAPMVGKAPLDDPKLSLGSFRGGYIRLWRGAEQRSWKSLRPGEPLLIGEGLEDVLSYLQFDPEPRAACAVSLSFMAAMELPPEFTEIRILAQRDPRLTPKGQKITDGRTVHLSPARKLLTKVIRRFEGEGRKVKLWTPPVFAKDINEYVQLIAREGVVYER
jgi:hypothetical protein